MGGDTDFGAERETPAWRAIHGWIVRRPRSIVSGGPCDGTSLEEGDIITEVDGETITSFADVYAILETHKPGDKIKVKYYSSSSGDGEVEITLQEDK